jgi:hypothetical protein
VPASSGGCRALVALARGASHLGEGVGFAKHSHEGLPVLVREFHADFLGVVVGAPSVEIDPGEDERPQRATSWGVGLPAAADSSASASSFLSCPSQGLGGERFEIIGDELPEPSLASASSSAAITLVYAGWTLAPPSIVASSWRASPRTLAGRAGTS